jgi:isopenicillin N synthase-like dioxygenase
VLISGVVFDREVLEEIFSHLTRTGGVVESILNECLGFPPEFLKEYNHDRSWDIMTAKHYFPATENENNGISEHEDGNLFTFVIQDEVGGLQVRKNGEWIPVTPEQGTIIVNVGDVIQVLDPNLNLFLSFFIYSFISFKGEKEKFIIS